MPSDRTWRVRSADGRQPVVTLIDGNPPTAAVAAMLLEQFGCRVLVARSVESALALLKQTPGIDLVLIDFAIRDMDPVVAAQLIRALGPRGAMPIIALTASASAASGPRGHAVDFARIVTKPYSPRELYTALDHALGRVAEGAASH
jgi:two-component system, sensor histidine kinase